MQTIKFISIEAWGSNLFCYTFNVIRYRHLYQRHVIKGKGGLLSYRRMCLVVSPINTLG